MAAPVSSGVLEAAVYVEDLDATEAFYGGLLGLERLTRRDGRHVFFRCGDSVILTFIAQATQQPPDPEAALPVPPHGAVGPGHVCLAADADQLNEWERHLRDNNVEIEADFYWPNGARSIYLRDPAGNSVEIADKTLWRRG
ncbi:MULTISPECIES: VOC family protein [Thioclava]|uniref:Glyoxalase/bleomycin resistance/extradiol dioxygenase family protein n=1 Tax=Thioclava electrotropha TaxID=1549850 RepID=A0ABX6YSU8_9RHOB|nr:MULTISPECIES: VOC family protein [Thioclava]OOY21464.1 bleomycin resistance protein [Thioclava sp. DLFJ5-1]OOY33155.1 bleomycin resistance protein [Thioclava sp. F36-6]QPZ90602.1 glyoxalase/bleomycin resistance/extradiol dioxygenase family protein [Thioclava electrotropha]